MGASLRLRRHAVADLWMHAPHCTHQRGARRAHKLEHRSALGRTREMRARLCRRADPWMHAPLPAWAHKLEHKSAR
eukprot:4995896-Prymnesium_polylepis.1